MSASPLSEHGRSPVTARPDDSDEGVRSNTSEAQHFYQRGVTAARAGQKRVAAGLLTRSVQLDPRNEGAWLWLSGVVDDPNQVAFCLNSVLTLNPNNERARRGLNWLQERNLVQADAAAAAATSTLPVVAAERQESQQRRKAREHGESWWVNWRQWRRDSRRVSLMWWTLPIIMLTLALGLYYSIAVAVAESQQPPVLSELRVPPAALAPPPTVPEEEATAESTQIQTPILEGDTIAIRESQTIAYLDSLGPLRQELRNAVDDYRNSTSGPGAAMSHVTAAQELHTRIEEGYITIQTLTPPPELHAAHEEYIQGLELELAAIEDLLEFYGSYRVELANRAVLRFQEANTHFDRARAMFDARLQQIEQESDVSSHTIR